MSSLARIPRLLIVLAIRTYQRSLGRMLPQRCRFHPTCSEYAVQAVLELGLIRGSAATAWRLLRCGPWTRGGLDPIPRVPGPAEASNV